MIIQDNFRPFFGVIEGVDDPEQAGRVQVRCYGYHSQNKAFIPTDYLNWFHTVVSNSSGVSGKGFSPTNYVTGSTVFGYFISDDMQDGIVIGSITGKPTHQAFADLGFNDPNGIYPIYTNESDVNRLARGDTQHWMFGFREDARFGRIQSPLRQADTAEPAYQNNAQYPMNFVFESRSGHVKELDDTPGSERIHEYHRTGTYSEIDPAGNKVVKVVGDSYDIIAGNGFAYVRGNVNLTIDGNCNQYIKGDWNIQCDGNKTEVVQGEVKQFYRGDWSVLSQSRIGIDGDRMYINSGVASGLSGIQLTLPVEYDVQFAAPVLQAAGRYAAFDEPIDLETTPDDYPQDVPPQDFDGDPKSESDMEDEEKATPELEDCLDITLPINYGTRISRNYTIGSLSRNALFAHDIVAQVGLTEQEIVCNLKALAENILEPVRAEFGPFRINSGFRKGSSRSQHNRGMAVDIQEPTWSAKKHLEVAEWVAENLPVDNLIVEHGRAIWLHMSFNRNLASQRGSLMTMINGRFESGLRIYY